jgi:hypothetical protein
MVGGHKPAGEKPALVFMVMPVNGCVCHAVPPQLGIEMQVRLLAKRTAVLVLF